MSAHLDVTAYDGYLADIDREHLQPLQLRNLPTLEEQDRLTEANEEAADLLEKAGELLDTAEAETKEWKDRALRAERERDQLRDELRSLRSERPSKIRHRLQDR